MIGKQTRLERSLNAYDGASIIIANVIGVGIFTTPGILMGITPGVGAFLSLWVAGGLMALVGAFAYADLASLMPKAGGEYIYIKKAFGPVWGFLSGWTSFIAGFSGAIAASSVGFAEYIQSFVLESHFLEVGAPTGASGMPVPVTPVTIIAIAVILFVTLFHIARIAVGSRFQNSLMLVNVVTLLALIGFGYASGSEWVLMEQGPSGDISLSVWLLALIPVMFTYSGWNAAVYLAEEIENPGKNMHRALIGGTTTVLVLYLLINILIVGTVPIERLAGSVDVMGTMSTVMYGPSGAVLFKLAILTALLSSISAMIVSGPRIYFAMARDNLFPSAFGTVHHEKRVPRTSICLQSAWAIMLAISGTFEQILIFTGFSIILFSALSVLALLVLDRRFSLAGLSSTKRVFYSLFVVIGFAMVINTMVVSPLPSLAGLALIFAGLPVYHWFSGSQKVVPV